jgi:hypothetical protein
MNAYGRAAIKAVQFQHSKKVLDPSSAWSKATCQIFGKGTSSQKKSCARDAYLGLCEAGLVKGIRPGAYTTSIQNKRYAIKAVQLLRSKPPSLRAE